ncbi:MAG: nucleotidyltransferase domain-containing protein [Cardiobacteriaceae bacterium]|nr:nucleotidyltransferase domain-containing protein [Cardiobacteriaceae bacterium]
MNELWLKPAHLQQLREILQRHFPGQEVWAYGSRVNGGAHEGSDLDLVVRGVVTREAYAACVAALQESTLPMLVDLHLWDGLPEDFRDNIARRYVVVQKG